MKPVAWFVNVVPRTLRAFFPSLARPDDAFAAEVLSADEYLLYRGMDRRDRHHGIAVARAVLAREPRADGAVLRAAILHDVGKSVAPYRAWERIAVHLYTPGSGERGSRPTAARPTGPAHEDATARAPTLGGGLRGAWDRHRRHAAQGAELIRAVGGGHDVADLVARHHDDDPDPRLALLRAADGST